MKEIEGASVQAAIDVMAEIYKQATNDLNRIIRDFKAASEEEKTGVYLVDTITRITGYLNDAKGAIRMAEPVAECAQCEGGGCKSCANTGFITRMMQQAAGAK
ncbi:MAG: Zn-binding domain-containing protein [Solirubrobacterales bacterium]